MEAHMKTIPFWTDGLEKPVFPQPPFPPDEVDVAIIGGGYTGLNAALTLAKHGASAAVFEQHTIGWGASSRNGGMATVGIKAPAKEMVKRYGLERGRQFWQASLDAIDLIEQLVNEEGLDCHFCRSGHVALAFKPSHFENMKKSVAWYKDRLGHTMNLVAPSEIQSEIGSTAFYGGMSDETSSGLHPAKYVFELARVVSQMGVPLCENTAVTKIQRNGTSFNVQTNQGLVKAKEVLVATNGYTDRLVPKLKPRIFPVGSYIIVTEPLSPELQDKLSPKRRMFYDTKNFLNYFRLTPDGRMLFGGRNNLSTGLDLEESARRLQERMVEVYPDLSGVPITHSWTGRLGLTFDLMPHIGRIEGIHYALGYGGHGVSIATYIGTEVGLLLAGQKTSSPFMEIAHPTRFFYRNQPWFLPFAATYYRILDWLS
jgi:glycine/D-amino acid oxidase-like deaminating enzyme